MSLIDNSQHTADKQLSASIWVRALSLSVAALTSHQFKALEMDSSDIDCILVYIRPKVANFNLGS